MPAKISTENLDATIDKQIREQLEKELKEFGGWEVKVVGPAGHDPKCTFEVRDPDKQVRTGSGVVWDPEFRTGGNRWDSERTVRKIVEDVAHIVESQEKAS